MGTPAASSSFAIGVGDHPFSEGGTYVAYCSVRHHPESPKCEFWTFKKIASVRVCIDGCGCGRPWGCRIVSEPRTQWSRRHLIIFKEDTVELDVRNWLQFAAIERYQDDRQQKQYYDDSQSLSGGEKAKLAYSILASAIAFQFGIREAETRPQSPSDSPRPLLRKLRNVLRHVLECIP